MGQALDLEEKERLYLIAEERLSKGDKISWVIKEYAVEVGKNQGGVANTWYSDKIFKDLREKYKRTPRVIKDMTVLKKKDVKKKDMKKKEVNTNSRLWNEEEDEVLVSQVDELISSGISIDKACDQVKVLFDRVSRTQPACRKRYDRLKALRDKATNPQILAKDQPQVIETSVLEEVNDIELTPIIIQPSSIVHPLRLVGRSYIEGEEILRQLHLGIEGFKNKISALERDLTTTKRNYTNLDKDYQLLLNEHIQLKQDHRELAKVFRGIKKLMQEAFGEDVVPDPPVFVQDDSGSIISVNK